MSARQAVVAQLETGSITRVYNREDGIENPRVPYVVLWKETPTTQNVIDQGLYTYRIACHVQVGKIDQLDNYIETEVFTLLHRVQLEDPVSNNMFDTYVTKEISPAIRNDDNSVSRDILIQTPAP